MPKRNNPFLSRPFIGCYRLQEETILQAEESVSAVYRYEECELRMSFSEKGTTVQEYVKGERIKETSHLAFDTAFFHHFGGYESLRHEAFLCWKRRLERLPNVFVEPFAIGRIGCLFFPGIFLFYMSVPVKKENYGPFRKMLWYNGLHKKIAQSPAINVYQKSTSGVEWKKEELELVVFSLAWHEVYGLCEFLLTIGMIDRTIGLPWIVQEYNSAALHKSRENVGEERKQDNR